MKNYITDILVWLSTIAYFILIISLPEKKKTWLYKLCLSTKDMEQIKIFLDNLP